MMENDRRDRNEEMEFLYRAFLTLQTPEECRRFLEDLCSHSEIEEMSRRLKTARLLQKNHVYADIAEETGLSTATISRVNRCIKYGDGGYETVLERMEKQGRR